MKVGGEIHKPANEIAARPIEGLNCTRNEQSGKRFWAVIQELCGEPENFFRHCFVYNICPLAFLTSTGRNITPPEIKVISPSQLSPSNCLSNLFSREKQSQKCVEFHSTTSAKSSEFSSLQSSSALEATPKTASKKLGRKISFLTRSTAS